MWDGKPPDYDGLDAARSSLQQTAADAKQDYDALVAKRKTEHPDSADRPESPARARAAIAALAFFKKLA